MTVFGLLTETAKADRDLLMKNDESGDDFNKQRLGGGAMGVRRQ